MDNKILLGKVGEWIWYKFYFDKENNCFIKEKYHEEYLDTGTVFDGSDIVTAEYVYNTFVEYMNADGITKLLECITNFELPQASENQITEQEFLEKLEEIDKAIRYNSERIDSTYILRNQQGSIIGVLSETKHFFAYVDLYGKRKGFISENEAFAYIIECLRERYSSSDSIPVSSNTQPEEQYEKPKKKSDRFGIFFGKK